MASPQTRPTLADQLENASHALDMLIRDAGLPSRARHDLRHAALEERAQAIAASIVAPFRGDRAASAPPIAFEARDGKSAAWF